MHYYIQIITSKGLINRPKLTYCLNLPQESITKYSLMMPINCESITLIDWSPVSESVKETIENSKKQGAGSSFITSNGISAVIASMSGMFLFGLMMIEMIYLLKYVNVYYPINALALFENKQSIYTLFFQYKFVQMEDINVLPETFIYYGVSPYFLNNCGEILCQIAALIIFCILLFGMEFLFRGKFGFITNIINVIKSFFIWDMVILFIFLSVQKLFFYISCSLCFFPLSQVGMINSLLALFVLVLLFVWISGLFFHAKRIQNYNMSVEMSPTLKSNYTGRSNNMLQISKDNSSLISLRDDINTHKFIDKNEVSSNHIAKNKIQPADDEFNEKIPHPDNLYLQETNHTPTKFKKNPFSNDFETNKIDKTDSNVMRISIENNKTLSHKRKLNFNCFSPIFMVYNWISYVKRYESLFEDLNTTTFWQKYYKLFYYMRQILISILIPSLNKYPIPQMIMITLLYGSFICYTLLVNPFQSKMILIINIVSEFICFSAILSVLIMVFLDFNENTDYELKMNLGWVIIFANISLLYWVICTGVIKVIYHLWFKFKQYKLAGKVTPE